MHQVNVHIDRPDSSLVDRLKRVHFQAALIAAELERTHIMDSAIKPLAAKDWSVCGPAVTVQLDYLDILMCGAATKVCEAGDVIVIAAKASMERAVWGGSLTRSARLSGAVGVIVDGAVECTEPILEEQVPVFCRGVYPLAGMNPVSPNQPVADIGGKPGSVNVPVVCGGVVVNPGDVVFGNQDGLAVMRKELLPQVIEAVEARHLRRLESIAIQRESNANFFDFRNGMDSLKAAGVEWND